MFTYTELYHSILQSKFWKNCVQDHVNISTEYRTFVHINENEGRSIKWFCYIFYFLSIDKFQEYVVCVEKHLKYTVAICENIYTKENNNNDMKEIWKYVR